MRYTREDGCRAWLTYGLYRPDIMHDLLAEYGCAEAIYDRFTKTGGDFLKSRTSESGYMQLKEQAKGENMHQMMLLMQQLNIGIISYDDKIYPDSLRKMQLPPALLFYRGNLDCLMGKCIAVVGSRRASPQGLEVTRKICSELSKAGVVIVSGLAMGIDSAAHEGCLTGESPTAAVLGCGIDVDYPIENTQLKERIVKERGVLLSEYPLGFHANKFVFQMRNRIISGLGRALLMMESRIQSGSMLTVQHALEQGKEVYAYPGIPGTEWAEGAHQLLREGANFFTGSKDILEDMGWDKIPHSHSINEEVDSAVLNDVQRRIYTALSDGERSFDELAVALNIPVPELTASLTMLQMMGLVKSMPGKSYCRV